MIALDPDVLRSFVAIAEHGSYARAGDIVHKTQSTVSMQMKRLEEALGVPLFRKDGRRNVVTDEGERLLEYARRLVQLNDEAVQTFRKPDLAGAISIGTPDDYAEAYLPEILARFARSHPRVEVSVVCEASTSLARRVDAGELDVALVTCEPAISAGEVILTERLCWVTSTRHCAHQEPVLPIALSQIGCVWRQITLDALNRAGLEHRIAYTSANGAAISSAVLSGLAIAALPSALVRPGMRILGQQDGLPSLGSFSMALLSSPDPERRPVVAALAQHVRDCFSTMPPGRVLDAAE